LWNLPAPPLSGTYLWIEFLLDLQPGLHDTHLYYSMSIVRKL
jgi:hypothetical protein